MPFRGIILVPAFLVVSGLTQPGHANDVGENSIPEALAAADRFYAAFVTGDEAVVEQMTPDNYLQTDVDGHVQDRTAWLNEYLHPLVARMKAGQRWRVFERHVEAQRVVGNTVVLAGTITLQASSSTTAPRTLRFTQVWQKRGGAWLRSVVHNAWVPEPRGK